MPVLHQLAALSIDQSFPWRESWLKNLGDLVLDEEQHHPNLPTLELRYLPRAQLDCMRELTKDIMVGPHSVYDGRNRLLLELNRQSLVLHSARPCLEWMEWGLQLIMLRAGATFIHSAAVEKAGRAVVFASWGRVGKTPLLIGLIRDQGWNLLGDDLVILTQDGRCLGFPKPMVLYPYHQPLLPEVFAAGRGPVTPSGLNFLLAHLGLMLKPVLRNIPYIHQLARKYNPQSVRIKPSEVFGDWKIATEAKLELIVWLDRRKGITKPEVHAADATLSSRIIGSTINAYDPWCLRLTEVAMGLGLISPGQYQSAWEQIIAKGVKGARQVFLFLPDSIPMGEISSVAAETLKLWELLGS